MSEQKQIFPRDGFPKKTLELSGTPAHNLFIDQARDSSLVNKQVDQPNAIGRTRLLETM